MTESTKSDILSNSNEGIKEIALDSSSKDSESASSSERDSRSTSSSEKHSLANTSSAPIDHSSVETINKKLSERLCDCTNTIVGDAVFMCLVLGVRHNLI